MIPMIWSFENGLDPGLGVEDCVCKFHHFTISVGDRESLITYAIFTYCINCDVALEMVEEANPGSQGTLPKDMSSV